MNNNFDDIYQDVGQKYGIDPDFLKAQGIYESKLDPKFKNPDSSASGIAAFTDATAKDYGVDRSDPRSSIEGQARYLKANYDKFKDSDNPSGRAVSAYKTGPNSDDYDSNYVDGINSIWQDLKKNKDSNSGTAPNTQAAGTDSQPAMDPAEEKWRKKIQSYVPSDNAATPDASSAPATDYDSLSPEDKFAAKMAKYSAKDPTAAKTSVDNSPQGTYNKDLAGARLAIPGNIPIGSGGGVSSAPQKAPEAADKIPLNALPGIASDVISGKNTQGIPAAELAYANNVETSVPGMHEAGAGIAAGLGAGQGDAFADRYNDLEQKQQALRQAGQEANPGATLLGQISGAALTTPMLPEIGGGGTTPLGRIGSGTATGATYGGAYGLGTGDASKDFKGSMEDRLTNGLQGAMWGGGLGAAVPAAVESGRGAANMLSSAVTPESSEATNALHDIVDGPIGQVDLTEYIKGSKPTLGDAAAYAGDPNAGKVAALEKTMAQSNAGSPGLFNQAFADRDSANNAARRNHILGLTGSTDDLIQAQKDRADVAKGLLEDDATSPAIWRAPNVKPANVQPVLDTIKGIVTGPDRGNDAVTTILGKIQNKLTDAKGDLESDPEYLYRSGIKTINQWLDSNHPADELGQLAKAARPQVLAVRNSLNDAIKDSAPGYANYLQQYSAASKPIDQMQTLQSLKLINPESDSSYPTLSKVNLALQKIAQERAKPGINDFKSLTPEQINGIRSLQSDLERDQAGPAMTAVKGSDTSQNTEFKNKLKDSLGDNGPQWPKSAGATAGAVSGQALGSFFGLPEPLSLGLTGLGSGVGEKLGAAYSNKLAAKTTKKVSGIRDLLLSPEDYVAGQKSNTASSPMSGANPFNPSGATGKFFQGTNYTPAIGYGANRLLQSAQPSGGS